MRLEGGGWWQRQLTFSCHTPNIVTFHVQVNSLTVPANFNGLSHPISKQIQIVDVLLYSVAALNFKVEIHGAKKTSETAQSSRKNHIRGCFGT